MSSAAMIWFNGRLQSAKDPCLSPFDRGFNFGDGVFETIRAHGRRPVWLEDHLSRLHQGAELLGVPVPFDDGAIADGLDSLLAAANYDASALRLTLSRGPSDVRGLWPSREPPTPTLLATVAGLSATQTPLRLAVARCARRDEASPLARIKSLNYGDNLLARRDAIARGMDDALMLNVQGRVACASIGNIFLRIDGRWRTPPVAEGALPGLARRRLLTILDAHEKPITRDELSRVEAACRSNSLGLAAVREIEGRSLPIATSCLDKLGLFGRE